MLIADEKLSMATSMHALFDILPRRDAFTVTYSLMWLQENADVPPVLWTFIGDVLRRYWDRSPTAVTAMELIQVN